MLLILFSLFLTISAYTCNNPGRTGKSFSPGEKWPSATVPYVIDASFTPENVTQLELAFAEYHTKTCIRFTPKTDSDLDYILLRINDSICGEADTCKIGGAQEVVFGTQCRTNKISSVMVHELGHVLCMGHEHTRTDRDEYLDFPGCSPAEIPGIDADFSPTSFYDYTSAMHGPCNTCEGGFPKNINVNQCGFAVTEGLSVLDADKLNDLYGCGGCHSYRYKKADNLSVDDLNSLVSGETGEGLDTFICRGYHSIGDIIPGVFYLSEMTCYIGFGGIETVAVDGEVLLWGPESGSNLRWVASDRKEIPEGAVAGGRTRDGETLFIVRALISIGEGNVYIPGKMHANTPYRAFTTFRGNEIPATDFDFLVCDSDMKE